MKTKRILPILILAISVLLFSCDSSTANPETSDGSTSNTREATEADNTALLAIFTDLTDNASPDTPSYYYNYSGIFKDSNILHTDDDPNITVTGEIYYTASQSAYQYTGTLTFSNSSTEAYNDTYTFNAYSADKTATLTRSSNGEVIDLTDETNQGYISRINTIVYNLLYMEDSPATGFTGKKLSTIDAIFTSSSTSRTATLHSEVVYSKEESTSTTTNTLTITTDGVVTVADRTQSPFAINQVRYNGDYLVISSLSSDVISRIRTMSDKI